MKSKNSLSAETLGQISLIQSMVVHLPDKKKILTFVSKGLKDLPGVGKVEFRIYEKDGDDDKIISEQKQELLYRFILKLKGYEHGELLISLTDPALFSPYIPFIENLANMLTVIFEERRQRILNKQFMDDLEKRIYLRTKELEIEIEERKQAEKEIKMLADSLKSISECVTITDLENNLTYVNQSFIRTYGYSEKELIGQSIKMVGSPRNSSDYLEEIIAATWKGGWHGELWNKRKDGTEFPINLSTTVIYDNDNKPIGLIGIASDITKKKLAEEAIKASDEQFRTLAALAPVGIYLADTEGNCLYANQAWCNMAGLKLEQVLGPGWINGIHPEDREKVFANWQKMIDSQGKWGMEYRFMTSEGKVTFVYGLAAPQFNSEGKIIRYIGVNLDITQRKLAEEELKQSEIKYRTLFNNIADPVFIYGKNTHLFLDCNQAALDFYGYSIEEFRTLTPLVLHPPEETERVLKNIDKSEHDDHSYTHITKNGEKKFVDIHSAPINYQGKEGWICTIRDATLRKKAERIIIESQRLGAIGEMSSAVAHDFNNSLQSIFGNLELALLNQDISPRVRKYLEVIRSSTKDAATRVQMLQRFGGRKQANSNYSLLSLNDVVKDVVIQSRPLWKDNLEKEGKVIIIKTSYGKIPYIMGNEGELRAVLYNIIKNCIEAMPDGGGIFMETGKKEEGVYLTITDTGIGMDEETKSRIFQPFFTTKGFEAGRGLGMSGAYSVILEHEGKIFISKSAPGEGTTLEIILPYAPKDELKRTDEKESDYEGSASVLWVEDDKMIREIATEMLDCLGHTGDVVSSGLEALEFMEQKHYDLVITDIGMPGMSGWQLADKIKEKYKGKMKVAVLTGWGAQIDDNKKNEHGVGYVLGKPFHISQLEKLIGEALQVDPN